MKIAVATDEKNENAEISEKAGRASYYLIFDEEGALLETISNPFSQGGGGAGLGVSKMLADKSVDIVVAGRFGENMEGDLKSRGLKFFEKSGEAKSEARTVA